MQKLNYRLIKLSNDVILTCKNDYFFI